MLMFLKQSRDTGLSAQNTDPHYIALNSVMLLLYKGNIPVLHI